MQPRALYNDLVPQLERSPASELTPELLHAFSTTFLARPKVYALQRAGGRYVYVKRPCTPELVAAHLAGRLTLGAYALGVDNRSRWLCLDADTAKHWDGLRAMARNLQEQGVTAYLEHSRRGGHLWLFFAPMP